MVKIVKMIQVFVVMYKNCINLKKKNKLGNIITRLRLLELYSYALLWVSDVGT